MPTISSILGLPPPYSNLGAIILNSLPFSGDPNIPFKDWQFALINLWANVKQVRFFEFCMYIFSYLFKINLNYLFYIVSRLRNIFNIIRKFRINFLMIK